MGGIVCPFSERHLYILLRVSGVSDPYLTEASQNQRRYPAPPIFLGFGVAPFTMFGMGGGIGAHFFFWPKKKWPPAAVFFYRPVRMVMGRRRMVFKLAESRRVVPISAPKVACFTEG